MDTTIQEVRPDELADTIELGEVTLVLGAPGIGTSQQLRPLGQSVERLPETDVADDGELVIVEDFVSAAFALDDESLSTYLYEYGQKSLFSISGGAVLVTNPRSFDWLCRSDLGVSGSFIETVDRVVVVRTPPTAAGTAIDEVRQRLSGGTHGLGDDERAAVLERARYPPYYFTTSELQEHLGWYDGTVTPEAFLPLSKHDTSAVLLPGDVRRVFERYEITSGPFDSEFADVIARLLPRGGLPSRIPNERSPAVLAALALVAVGIAEDGDWLDSLVRNRTLSPTAEALERALDLPPGTVDHLQVFAGESMRARIRERLTADDEESIFDVSREALDDAVDALQSESASLETVSTDPEAYGSSPLVGAWHWDGPEALHEAAAERELPGTIQEADETDEEGLDWRSFVDGEDGNGGDDLLDALDGGLVVLSGPRSSGKRQVAATLASELEDWGTTVKLPDLRNPDQIRTGVEATPNTVVVATYGAEPAKILGDDGVRALPEWVGDGSCAGALLICDDTNRERLDEIAERAGCDELPAWTDRVEFSVKDPSVETDRDPAAVAQELLDAIGWNTVQFPSRRNVDVESVADQSTLAAIASVPDHALDGAFVGRVLAEVVDIVSTTHGPDAAQQWLSFVDDLVADVGRNRSSDTEGALQYRGEVYETAITAVALANPRTDEWVHAVALGVLEVTNEVSNPHEESIGGNLEPFATAFSGALARLAQPPDGSVVNHGAIGCVDETLHAMVADDGWRFPLHFVYGKAVGRIVRRAENPAAANGGLATIVSLVRQYASSPNDHFTTVVLAQSFGSMLGAVADGDCSPEAMADWVADIQSRASDAVAIITDQDAGPAMLEASYVAAVGQWVFEHECSDDRIGPWLDAVGRSMANTATVSTLDVDPEAFVTDAYGGAVRTVVQTGNLDRAEQLFATCHRLVDSITDAGHFDAEQELRAVLHATALAAFGNVEQQYPDQVSQYPYGVKSIPFDDSLGFEDWMALYDESVTRGGAATESTQKRTQHLTAVYRDALSTAVQGFEPDSADSDDSVETNGMYGSAESGHWDEWNMFGDLAEPDPSVTPREEHTWYTGITDCIEARASSAESVDNPVQFLADVYGGAAVRWAADGASSRTQEWVTVLVQSLRHSRESIDEPDETTWFNAFAAVDAEILTAVLTRSDVGERTHERLVKAVLSQIETAATAPDNPPHPVVYVASVFGGALGHAAGVESEEVRFCVIEVLSVLDDQFSLDWIELDRADIFERIFAEAFATVGRTHTDSLVTDEWLEIVSARIESTATREAPDRPDEFVADVYVRALFEAVQDDADEWRRRLDSELRDFTRGPYVNDSEAFLEALYADVVVKGAESHGPRTRIEACIDAVNESVQDAIDADLLRADGAHERTFSNARDTLFSANVRERADYIARLDQGLQATDNGDISSDIFDAEGVDDPADPADGPDSTTDCDTDDGENPPRQEDR
ncbi:hypothetical protein [Haloarcula sp. CBA1127]|uniref:hypothetical protein n=1 Tax=Haloarcula sp. CBA1127 TaxID=1765055 RepID=UPI00073E63A7|nr:hypothetical protein [Haloarcula sp. CBA1127]